MNVAHRGLASILLPSTRPRQPASYMYLLSQAPGGLDLFRGTVLLLRGKLPSGRLMEAHHQHSQTPSWSLCFLSKMGVMVVDL